MKIHFNLYSGSGLESSNVLDVANFREFEKILKEQGNKQAIRITKVTEGK